MNGTYAVSSEREGTDPNNNYPFQPSPKLSKRQRKWLRDQEWRRRYRRILAARLRIEETYEETIGLDDVSLQTTFPCAADLQSLPLELWTALLKYLPPHDRCSLRLTSTIIRQQVDTSGIWVHRRVDLVSVMLYDNRIWTMLRWRELRTVSFPDQELAVYLQVLTNIPTVEVVQCKSSVFNCQPKATQLANLRELTLLTLTLDDYRYTSMCRCAMTIRAMNNIASIQVVIHMRKNQLPNTHQIKPILDLAECKKVICVLPNNRACALRGRKRKSQAETVFCEWLQNLEDFVGDSMNFKVKSKSIH